MFKFTFLFASNVVSGANNFIVNFNVLGFGFCLYKCERKLGFSCLATMI